MIIFQIDVYQTTFPYHVHMHLKITHKLLILLNGCLCEQLCEEAERERVKVSIVCKDLVRYSTDHQTNDALVGRFQSSRENPFRDKQKYLPL
ncbi:hypothetical protein I4U23_013206 [Adineta vaga]|nr:hypothetical protein I4U23_013206 [Adineta vaga]